MILLSKRKRLEAGAYCIQVIAALILFIILSIPSRSQQREQINTEWESLNDLYNQKALNDTQYMAQGNALLDKYVTSPWIEDNTELFQSVLSSKSKYNRYRSEYFKHLGRNAVVNRNMGKAIFYYEQRDKELENEPGYIPTLSAAFLNITELNKMHKTTECIRAIEKVLPFIDSLPQLVDKSDVPLGTLINTYRILSIAINCFDTQNFKEKADRAYHTLTNLHQAVLRKNDLYPVNRVAMLENDIFFVDYSRAKAQNNLNLQEKALKARIEHCKLAGDNGKDWAHTHLTQTYMYLAYVYMNKNQLDSAQKYTSLHIQTAGTDHNPREEDASIAFLLNELEFKKGNYQSAYENLLRSKKITDSLNEVQYFEMDANNYAQAEAAFVKQQLHLSQLKAESRQRWTAAIAVASIMMIIITIMVIYRIRRTARHKMQLLRAENQLQIAEMENKNNIALFEEQQRLGMQLHDTIAGDLLGIKMFMELQVKIQLTGSPIIHELEQMIADSYTKTRKLSHQWYNGIAENIEIGFLEKLNKVIDQLAPPDRYEREVYVDQAVFSTIPGGLRIQLLHIIQEALYNIVKHAKATKIGILLEETRNGMMLTIRDNGIGFNVQKVKKGVGMESMRERAQKILARMNIESGDNGTVLQFMF